MSSHTTQRILLACLAAAFLPAVALADIGVGVGSGKITVTESLRPGVIYELPALPVLNTGDEPSDYAVSVEYHQDQPQLQPAEGWFTINPASFRLGPKESKLVHVTLSLPLKTTPGDYFAYLSAHPVKKDIPGQTSVGIAAAAKLYFTVAPANILQGLYYRTVSFIVQNSPLTYIILALAAGVVLIMTGRRFLKINIGISMKR